MKAKHLIIWHFLIAGLLLTMVGCANRTGWVCRHYVSHYGTQYLQEGRRIDIVRGMIKGDHLFGTIYQWEGHIKIEDKQSWIGWKSLDTARGGDFRETQRWRLNQGFPEEEQLFLRYAEWVQKEGL